MIAVKSYFRIAILFFLIGLSLHGCRDSYSPKPRAYFRIDLPDKEYHLSEDGYPYLFEQPAYGQFMPDTHAMAEPYWANIVFPQFKGTLHLSYKPVHQAADLAQYFEDARSFTRRHIPKATAIREEVIQHHGNRVYGLYYQIKGKEAASPVQFYLTDSTTHFLRAALYFDVTPNNDSLAPVIQFLEEDIRVMIESLQWR